MITSTLRRRLAHPLILAAFVFASAFAANPTPRGGGPGVPSPTTTRAATPSPTATPAGAIDEKLFKGMQWRQIGPFRGGRALAIEGVPGEPDTYYFGAVAGGVWKTIDGGANWTPLFDKENISSIGAIAVARFRPQCRLRGHGRSGHSRKYDLRTSAFTNQSMRERRGRTSG